jgi:hypothetical protein
LLIFDINYSHLSYPRTLMGPMFSFFYLSKNVDNF